MPEIQMESLPFPWVTTQTSLKILKMGKSGVLGVLYASPSLHTRPKIKLKPTFEMYTLEISLMMPENHIELLP